MLSHALRVELDVTDLHVAYDTHVALTLPSFKLSGNTIAILGHNGAGKSTFIKALLGLLSPQKGQIAVHLEGNGSLTPYEHMAFCPETGAVFADISVESYVRLWCRLSHNDSKYYMREGAKIIDLLNITPLFNKLGRELSKGQRRRVQTAIGFLTSPKLFLFDEPFDGLDVQKTNELTDIIIDKSPEMAFAISSHRMDVVERLADAFIVLKEGKIAAMGSHAEVCKALASHSVVLSNLQELDHVAAQIRGTFTTVVVSRVGTQLIVTGHEAHERVFAEFLQQVGAPQAHMERIQASLVDAMNYHLKGLH